MIFDKLFVLCRSYKSLIIITSFSLLVGLIYFLPYWYVPLLIEDKVESAKFAYLTPDEHRAYLPYTSRYYNGDILSNWKLNDIRISEYKVNVMPSLDRMYHFLDFNLVALLSKMTNTTPLYLFQYLKFWGPFLSMLLLGLLFYQRINIMEIIFFLASLFLIPIAKIGYLIIGTFDSDWLSLPSMYFGQFPSPQFIVPYLFTGIVLLFHTLYGKKRPSLYVLTGLLFGLVAYVYPFYFLVVCAALALFIIYFYINRDISKLKSLIPVIIISLLVSSIEISNAIRIVMASGEESYTKIETSFISVFIRPDIILFLAYIILALIPIFYLININSKVTRILHITLKWILGISLISLIGCVFSFVIGLSWISETNMLKSIMYNWMNVDPSANIPDFKGFLKVSLNSITILSIIGAIQSCIVLLFRSPRKLDKYLPFKFSKTNLIYISIWFIAFLIARLSHFITGAMVAPNSLVWHGLGIIISIELSVIIYAFLSYIFSLFSITNRKLFNALILFALFSSVWSQYNLSNNYASRIINATSINKQLEYNQFCTLDINLKNALNWLDRYDKNPIILTLDYVVSRWAIILSGVWLFLPDNKTNEMNIKELEERIAISFAILNINNDDIHNLLDKNYNDEVNQVNRTEINVLFEKKINCDVDRITELVYTYKENFMMDNGEVFELLKYKYGLDYILIGSLEDKINAYIDLPFIHQIYNNEAYAIYKFGY